MFNLLQEADVSPTSQTVTAMKDLQKKLVEVEEDVKNIRLQTIPAINKQLKKEGLAILE